MLEQKPKVKIDSPEGMGTAAESRRIAREYTTTTYWVLITITTTSSLEAFNAIATITTSEVFIATTRAPYKTKTSLAMKA